MGSILSFFTGPTKANLRFSVKLAFAAVITLWVARLLRLESPLWAGISAVVVCGGSFGGSYASGFNRAAATVVGLAVGFIFAMAMGSSLAAGGLAIVAGAVACEMLNLKGGVKLGAGSTLIPTVVSPTAPLLTSFERAGCVLLGCVIGVLVNIALWPEKAMTKLDETLRQNVADIGRLLAKAVRSYADGTIDGEIEGLLAKLKAQNTRKSNLLKEIVYEPEPEAAYRTNLQRLAAVTRSMAEQVIAVLGILGDAQGDSMRFMMKEEFGRLAEKTEAAASAFRHGPASPEYIAALNDLEQADENLENGFEEARKQARTNAYPTKEVLRFSSILYVARTIVQNLKELQS